jgi:PAS domain S-box-containing protein
LTHPFANNPQPQELLKHSEEQFRTFVANIPGAVYRCIYDEQLKGLSLRTMLFLSEAIETVTGYSASDFINNRVRSFTSIIHPQDRTKIEQAIRQSVIAKQPYVIEYRIIQANGRTVWVYDKGQGICDENGDIQWLDGVILDVTERKTAEADLRYTQTFLNSVVEHLPMAVFIKDAIDLRVMYWNKASEELFGYSREEVLGKNDYEFLPAQQARYLRANDRQVLAGGELVDIAEAPLITPHRGKRIVHSKKVPLIDETGTPRYLLGICRDITEEKLADTEAAQSAQALRESESHYRRIVETATEGVWMFDANSKTTFANSRIAEMLGYTVEEMQGRSFFDFMDQESRVQAQAYVERRRQGIRERHDFKFCRKDGSRLWAIVSATPILDAEGQFVGVLRMITDISDRKQAEEALRESHQQIADILERITDAFFALDHQWHFTYINGEASHLLHQKPEQLIGANFWDVFPEAVGSLVEQQYRQAMQEQVPVIFETFSAPLNSWLEVRAYPSGSGLSVFWRDITEQKQAQDALRKSEEQYRTLASHFPNGAVLAFDRDLRYTLAEGEALATLGLSKELVEGKTLWEARTPQFCEILEPHYRAALSGVAGTFELEYANHTYLVHTLPLKNDWGEVFAGMVMKQDITERKRAEEQLQERELFLRSIYDGVEDSIFVVDVLETENSGVRIQESEATREELLTPGYEFRYRGLNPAHERVAGIRSADLRGKTPQEVFPPAVAAAVSERYEECVRTGTAISYEECLPFQGKDTWWITTLSPLRDRQGQIYRLVGTSINISDRKQAEVALQESERRFRAIFDSMFQFIGLMQPDGTLLKANQTALDFGGLRLEDIAGRPFWEARWWSLSPQTQERLKAAIAQAASGEFVRYEVDVLGAGDRVITIDFSIKPVKDETGQVVLLIPEGRDISDRKRTEEALRQSESKLRAKNQELKQTLRQLKETQAQLIQNEKMVSLGQMVAGIAHEINNPISFIYGNIAYAHEYAQNLLNLVKLYGLHYPEPLPPIQEEIEALDLDFVAADFPKLLGSMQEGANRIREIVLSLRNFSRLDEAQIKPVNLHEGLDNTLLILQHRLKGHAGNSGIEVRKEYGQLPLVECYPGLLNQVFMNLLSNAIDALETQPEPRVITIRTEVETGDKGRAQEWESGRIPQLNSRMLNTPSRPPQFVVIRITDNGPGIPREVKKQIFDPFFTTKPVGVGTGLGLAIAHSIIVEQHGGNLTCISEPGQGAEFVIELPLAATKAIHS